MLIDWNISDAYKYTCKYEEKETWKLAFARCVGLGLKGISTTKVKDQQFRVICGNEFLRVGPASWLMSWQLMVSSNSIRYEDVCHCLRSLCLSYGPRWLARVSPPHTPRVLKPITPSLGEPTDWSFISRHGVVRGCKVERYVVVAWFFNSVRERN